MEAIEISRTENVPVFMSAEINEITAALSAFQGGVKQPELSKEVAVQTRTGGKYTFKYADLYTCVKSAAPMLKEHGLAVTQLLTGGTLVTLLTHKSGQWFKSELPIGKAADYQALGSAITYLKRYSYCAILGLVADSDDDANAACGNTATVKDRKATPAKKLAVPKTTAADRGAVAQAIANKPKEADPKLIAQAVAEINAATSREELAKMWDKWRGQVPSEPDTEAFNAARNMGIKFNSI